MEAVIRVAAIYALIVLGMRVLGKREFGQLSPVELVTLLLIPEIVSNALRMRAAGGREMGDLGAGWQDQHRAAREITRDRSDGSRAPVALPLLRYRSCNRKQAENRNG